MWQAWQYSARDGSNRITSARRDAGLAGRGMSVAGRLIAVTGAARGIGLATARRLAEGGAMVALGDLDGELAGAEAARVGPTARGYELNVTVEDSFAGFLDAASRDFGRPLDVLVNNAGIMWVGPFDAEPAGSAERQMAVNFHGTARGMRLAAARMKELGRGHIVNVASAASRVAPPGEASYAATKHAVYGYSVAVREELRASGIELSLIMPVVVETELAAGTSHGRVRRLAPEDVAAAIQSAIERPRFEVFVPRELAALVRVKEVLPQRARDRFLRAMVPDQVAATDAAARASYQERLTGP